MLILAYVFLTNETMLIEIVCYSETSFKASVDLPIGEHLFKFIVDEQWVIDKDQVYIYFIFCYLVILRSLGLVG